MAQCSVTLTERAIFSSQEILKTAANSPANSIDIVIEFNDLSRYTSDRVGSFGYINEILNFCYTQTYSEAFKLEKYFMDVNVLFKGYSTLGTYDLVLTGDDIPSDHRNELTLDYSNRRYHHVAVGGTFDHLHIGHKILLSMAVWLSHSSLTCGVFNFSPENIRKKAYFEHIQTLETRMKNVDSFLKKFCSETNSKVVPISDVYGPTIFDRNLDAIVCSVETKNGCDEINHKRKEKGLPPLDVYPIKVVSSVEATDDIQVKLGSTFLRSKLH